MPITLTPDQVSSFVPDAPAPGAPIPLTPEQIASFRPDENQPAPALDIMRDFTAEQIAALAGQDASFNIFAAYDSVPPAERTPEMLAKAQEAYNQVRQQPWYKSTPVVSGLVAGDMGQAWEGAKQVAGNVAHMASGAGQYIGNVAGVAAGNIAGAVAPLFGVDEAARAQNELETQRRAAEGIAATEAGIAGLVHQAGQIGGTLSRATGLAKPIAEYSPEEKQKDFLDALARHQIQKETMAGHGPLLSNIPSAAANVANLEAAGMPVRPERVGEMAAGEPLTFMLFGQGMKAATGAAKFAGADIAARTGLAEPISNLVSKLPTAEKAGEYLGGKAITTLGKAAELGTLATEKAAPLIGATAGATVAAKIPFVGELPFGFAHVAGALEGWRAGKAAATSLHKLGQQLKPIAEFGKGVSTGAVTGAYQQAAKDIFGAAPGVLGAVGHGAAFDLGLAATMDMPEERQGLGMGVAFGLLGGATKGARHVISGQLIAPREFVGAQSPLPGSGQFPALEAMHRAAFDSLAPGQKVRLNATKTFLKGANPNADIFVGTPETIKAALIELKLSPETAEKWSQQNGMTFEIGDRKIAIVTTDGLSAAPHEARHAIENVIGEDSMRQLDREIISKYPIDELGRQYAGRLTGIEAAPDAWREILLDATGVGRIDAAEKLLQDALTKYHDEARKAGNPPPSDAEIRQLVENQVKDTGIEWRDILTPEEATDAANRYVAREIAAENFDAWFKHTGGTLAEGKQIPEVLARWAGSVMQAFGAEPLAGRVSEGLKVPLTSKVVTATAEQAKGFAPVIKPAVAAPTGRVPAGPVIPRTPEEIAKAATDAAELAKTAPDVALPGAAKSQREILGITSEAIANRSAIKLNYLSAPEEPAAAISSKRGTRREMIELYRRMPEEARSLWEKTFFPETVGVTKEGKYQVQGWAPEVFAANAQKLAEAMIKNPDMAKLSPYSVDPATGSFTKDSWLALYGDAQTFVKNQQAGFTGSGAKLVVPGEMQGKGFFKPPQKSGQELSLDQTKADFINMLFNFQLPKTTKLGHGKFPLNIAGQEVSTATMPGRLVEPLTPRGEFAGPKAQELGIEGRTILEVNPLRAQMEAAAKAAGETMPSFIEVIQKLNLDRILEADHAPEAPQFRGNTLTLSAGFMPGEGGKRVEYTTLTKEQRRDVVERMKNGSLSIATFIDALPGLSNADMSSLTETLPTHILQQVAKRMGADPTGSRLDVMSAVRRATNRFKDVDASFMPGEGKKPITIEGPDGKKYRAMFDGYQDFSAIGKGKLAQITALEDIPGVTTARSTTYSESLEKGGYKVPPLDKAQFSPADMKKDVEQVREAAYRMPDGKLLTGPTHSHAYMKGEKAYPDSAWATAEDGFVTTKDRFVSRDEALDLAVESGQMKREHYEDTTTNKTLESVDFYKTRQREEANFWGDKEPAPGEPMAQFVPPEKIPEKTVKVYKLFGTRKNQPGKIFPLFIGAKVPTPMGEWIAAENIPTKGFSNRPGWHVGMAPRADHLLTKEGKLAEGRVWAEAEIPADVDWQTRADASKTKDIRDEVPVGGHYSFRRPARQGGEWKIAGALKVNRILDAAEVDAINSGAGVEPKAQFMHSLEGIKKMNDREVERQKRGAESETTRLSSYTGDAESGIVIHSAKNRSTAFMRGGEEAKKFLEAVKSAEGDAAKNALIEEQYAQASFMPKDTSRKAKPDYKLREGPGKFAKAWIAPDGTPIQLGGQWHHEWINENPGEAKKYGLKATTSGEENRVDALKKGFARVNYDKNSGTLTVEARKKDWPVLGESIRKLVKENLGKIDNMDVKLLDDKASRVVESEGVQLFTYEANEKMDNLPLLSAPSSTTEMSAQATPGALTSERVRYMPGGPPEAIKQAAVRDRETGKVYEGYAHFAARQAALGAGVAPHKVIQYEDGFTTNDGKFLNREEAFKRAVELKQYVPKVPVSENFTRNFRDERGQLESAAFEHQQNMREMGYEPDVQFTPGYKSKEFDAELEKVRTGANFGQTFKPDGTVWQVDKRKPTDIVTLASVNLPKEQLTRENVKAALGPIGFILDEKGTALGVFELPGGTHVSVDVNALPSQKHRANSADFAKRNNQVSIWDPVKGEEVKTGGTGETSITDPRDAYDALQLLLKGKPPIIPDPVMEQRAKDSLAAGKPVPSAVLKNLTRAQKTRVYPESVEPKSATELIRSDIKNSPLAKQAGSEEAAIKAFSDKLVEMAEQYKDSPEYQEGLKWYSDFVPKLNAEFGEHAQLFAELLAATSPRNKPLENFKLSMEAVEQFKTGKFDGHVKKFLDGQKMIEDGSWEAWYADQLANKKVKGNRPATEPAFMAQWIKAHDLQPRQSNEKLYGMHSTAVLKVLARTWLKNVTGPKVSNFIQNLVGTGHGATIDVWANRTMRRFGYEGFQERWRLLPGNEAAVTDPDFFFSQKAFAHAAERLGVLPDALQGGLWFAEKKHWADRGWGRLDLGSYLTEIKKVGTLREGIAKRLAPEITKRPEK